MQQPIAPTPVQTVVAFARLAAAADALSSAIAGFALLAGARAFMFIALLGWREPVLGGAGLVLLALVGWLRWQCGGIATVAWDWDAARDRRPTMSHVNGACVGAAVAAGHNEPGCAAARNVACYNRPAQCDARRCDAL
ncbi:hypothetical protein LMG28614_00699 [Paraburkholderia ultramafica]|uniref:Uncharacterized protein n=1 Tax=Paraburkholderia ultramafica TaxID=1544867 RepID=A0A6S7AUU6_9BURK|nr:hypothetical protein LMG28614_00699 [Paraburkholderia ultramafica]